MNDETNRNPMKWKDPKKTTTYKSVNTHGTNKLNDIGERRLTRYPDKVKQYKTEHCKIKKGNSANNLAPMSKR